MLRKNSLSKLQFRDINTGLLMKSADKLAHKVEYLFPLLDPSLDFNEAVKRHQTWFVQNATFITGANLEMKPTFNETSYVEDS